METVQDVNLGRFCVADDYNGDKTLEHDCGWEWDWSWRDKVTLQGIVDAARSHADECLATRCENCGEVTPHEMGGAVFDLAIPDDRCFRCWNR